MTLWKWKALDGHGKIYRGVWEENFPAGVVSKLRSQELYPVNIQRSLLGSWKAKLQTKQERLYWARVCRKAGSLLEAGISLLDILGILIEQESSPLKKIYWQKIKQQTLAGNELSAGLELFHPRPGFFMESMIKAGEKSGTLAKSLQECALQLEEDHFFEQKIKTILFYPLFLLGTSLVVLYSLSVFVLPMYETIFQGLEADLPLLSKVIFFVGPHIPAFVGFLLLVMILLRSSRKGKHLFFPGTAQIRRYRLLVLFCTLLGRLLRVGIPLLESLTLLSKLTKGSDLFPLVGQLESAVQEGKRLSPVIRNYRLFPPESAKMLEAAEESGRLSEMLEQLSLIFKQELESKIEGYTKFLEPVLTLAMAGLIGFIALGVLLPLFELTMHIQ